MLLSLTLASVLASASVLTNEASPDIQAIASDSVGTASATASEPVRETPTGPDLSAFPVDHFKGLSLPGETDFDGDGKSDRALFAVSLDGELQLVVTPSRDPHPVVVGHVPLAGATRVTLQVTGGRTAPTLALATTDGKPLLTAAVEAGKLAITQGGTTRTWRWSGKAFEGR